MPKHYAKNLPSTRKTKQRINALRGSSSGENQNRLIKEYMRETGNLPPHGGGSQEAYDAWLRKKRGK